MAEFIVPRLEKLNSQPEVQKLLKGLLNHPGVQTFLWVGPEGTGKKTYALPWFEVFFARKESIARVAHLQAGSLAKPIPISFGSTVDYFWSDDSEDNKKQGIVVDVAKRLRKNLTRRLFRRLSMSR